VAIKAQLGTVLVCRAQPLEAETESNWRMVAGQASLGWIAPHAPRY